ncbi:MAG: hypothetical protein H6708_10545 [Kofleriaceae bacterium]|nr:hypothetical protein [Myxococcales bacterium]MCB9560834.1 hypothetical protein [Kofleriaceae bacterium]
MTALDDLDPALLDAPSAELAARLRAGRPVDAAAVCGWQYDGISLGLPAWIERLTWKKFAKAFHRDADGALRGWNLRCHQDGLDAPWRPRVHRSVPVTFGHFALTTVDDRYPAPAGTLLLDYGRGGNRRGDPVARLRDPVVALDDAGDRLLGCSLVEVAGRLIATPSYFVLRRGPRVGHVPTPPRR